MGAGGYFPKGERGRDVKLTIHLHLVPTSRVVELIPSPPYPFLTWRLINCRDIKACELNEIREVFRFLLKGKHRRNTNVLSNESTKLNNYCYANSIQVQGEVHFNL
jgi:hypothetical protein